MTDERIVEKYRGHELVAAFHKGQYKGKLWDSNRSVVVETVGSGTQAIIQELKERVDQILVDKAGARTSTPKVEEFVAAFKKLRDRIPDSYLAMLKAHYFAVNRTVTATQLAEAAGYENWNAANLHYGKLGAMLYELVPMELMKYTNGKNVPTSMLATPAERTVDESQWQWKMRPEIAEAIAVMGFCA